MGSWVVFSMFLLCLYVDFVLFDLVYVGILSCSDMGAVCCLWLLVRIGHLSCRGAILLLVFLLSGVSVLLELFAYSQ